MRLSWPSFPSRKSRAHAEQDVALAGRRSCHDVPLEPIVQDDPPERFVDLSGFGVELLPVHASMGFDKPMPIASARLDQEMELASGRAQAGDHPLSCTHSWKVTIDRNKLIVHHSSTPSPQLELDLFMSKLTGKKKGPNGLPCFALAEVEAQRHYNARHTWQNWWIFSASSDHALLSIIDNLLISGAVLAGVMKIPPKLLQIADSTKCTMYMGRSLDLAPIQGRAWNCLSPGETPESENRSSSKDSSNDTDSPELTKSPTLDEAALGIPGRDASIESMPAFADVGDKLLPEGSEEKDGLAIKCYSPVESLLQDGSEIAMPGSPESVATMDDRHLSKLATELKILSMSHGHKNIVRLVGFAQMPCPRSLEVRAICMTEYCSGGPLSSHVRKRGHMTEPEAASMMRGILAALSFLHGKGVLHRCVDPDHIILRSGSDEWVLCGFGSACWVADARNLLLNAGTVGYLAPEVIKSRLWSPAADVFSAGCVLFLAHMKKAPFGTAKRPDGTQGRTLAGEFDFGTKSGRDISDRYQAFVRELLSASAEARPTCVQACNNPWFAVCGKPLSSEQAPRVNADGERSVKGLARGRGWRFCRQLFRARRIPWISNQVTRAEVSDNMLMVTPGR